MTARTRTLPGRWRFAALVALLASLLVPPAAHLGAAGMPAFSTLQPGGFRTIRQALTVNVVFVGYRPGAGAREIALLREVPANVNDAATLYDELRARHALPLAREKPSAMATTNDSCMAIT